MTDQTIKELQKQLRPTHFSFLPSGEYSTNEIYQLVKDNWPELCDDNIPCNHYFQTSIPKPEWNHVVRRSLDYSKNFGFISKGHKKGYWIILDPSALSAAKKGIRPAAKKGIRPPATKSIRPPAKRSSPTIHPIPKSIDELFRFLKSLKPPKPSQTKNYQNKKRKPIEMNLEYYLLGYMQAKWGVLSVRKEVRKTKRRFDLLIGDKYIVELKVTSKSDDVFEGINQLTDYLKLHTEYEGGILVVFDTTPTREGSLEDQIQGPRKMKIIWYR